ncbi:MAG: hypothetical protein K2X72_16230 [Reyranella sp.]|nr:hypothetical protein [Reyranella sp.]
MTRTLTTFFAAIAVLGSVAATPLFAQETKPSTQPFQTQGTMGDHHGMMNGMGQMSPDQMQQMTKMVENCNRMMESMGNASAGHDKDQKPARP